MCSTDLSTSDRQPLRGSQDRTDIEPPSESDLMSVVPDFVVSPRERPAEPGELPAETDTEIVSGGQCISRKKDEQFFWEFRNSDGTVHDEKFSSKEDCQDFATKRV